ncbi:MAG: magnesium/cobalt transporter CorA [Deltaproteobacteria bacterium]|nr:magnesium/cobalt transporter CorA [Deltaproteobacteria bacterium]MCB9789192.1 magnesium/cobalt transporter CorA [Deltaproteobacteria bacterium]
MGKRAKGHHRSKKRRSSIGLPPGTLQVDPEAVATRVRVIQYSEHHVTSLEVADLATLPGLVSDTEVTWVDVVGLGDGDALARLGAMFHLHPLALEDVVNVHQRPKLEIYPHQLFMVTRLLALSERLETEQISIFLGPGFVLTFQEREGDCFEPLRDRIRTDRGRVRHSGADYLAYALLDAIVDSYFPVIEAFGDRLDDLEDDVLHGASEGIVERLMDVRRDLLMFRRYAWPMRDTVSALQRDDVQQISDETRIYLRDCHDHAVRVVDLAENFRDLGTSLMEVHLSVSSQRLNEVMKVLTMIATIFMPLGFIAGVYGMNFDSDASRWNMPELHWRFGYPFALGMMATFAGGFLYFFWRKGWFRDP